MEAFFHFLLLHLRQGNLVSVYLNPPLKEHMKAEVYFLTFLFLYNSFLSIPGHLLRLLTCPPLFSTLPGRRKETNM